MAFGNDLHHDEWSQAAVPGEPVEGTAVAFWLYASRSTLAAGAAEAEVARIVEVSLGRNPGLRVTGALIFTGQRFAQYIEGPSESLADLRASIARDPRHRDIVTLLEGKEPERRFAGWTLAYAGPALYVSRTIERPLAAAGSGRPDGADQLVRLMREFARSDG